MSKLAFRAQTVDIAYLPLRQDLFAKTVLMTAQRVSVRATACFDVTLQSWYFFHPRHTSSNTKVPMSNEIRMFKVQEFEIWYLSFI
jgi:hypothetical protein